VKDFYVDNSKIKKDLKIEFTKLDEGLKKTVDYFDSVIKQRGKYPLI
jgi:nucleoside-diphosphate-sugar epimerase